MSLALLLAERARREREAQAHRAKDRQAEYAVIADSLRSWLYPEQAAFFRSPAKRKATVKTRRAGATSGGCREFLARALERPGWRGMYCNEIRAEARALAWRSDTKQGMLDLLERLQTEGRITIATERRDLGKGADVKVDEQALTIDFRNGSQIRLFCADDARSLERARGGAPHVVWCDEAQKQPGLDTFVNEIIGPSLTDFDGELWLTGTPSQFLDGYFYDVTGADEKLPGWELHVLRVTDNPMYGSTPDERWARTAGAELVRNGWDPNNPPPSFRREWRAEWVREDARTVYSVHRWPEPVFAPMRTTSADLPHFLRVLDPNGKDPSGVSGYVDRWYDHAAAVRDLPQFWPGTDERMDWFFGLGLDFGFSPDPFALVLWAFCPGWPQLYEMFSWKRTLVLPDYQRDCVRWFFDRVPLVYCDADPAGKTADIAAWNELFGMPVEAAKKSRKRDWIEMLNNDGERGRVKLREGSPYLHEMQHLAWIKRGERWIENADRKLADGTVPGNHTSDAGLYGYRHYVQRDTSEWVPPPQSNTTEWAEQDARRDIELAKGQAREVLALEEYGDGWGYGYD